jgi:hypothetical protein
LNAGIGAELKILIPEENLGLDRLLLYKKSKTQENQYHVVIAEGDKIGKMYSN